MDGTERSLVDNNISITPPTPPPNERKGANDHGWRSPTSEFGSPGDNLYSPALSGPESPLFNSPAEGPYVYQRPECSPLPAHLHIGWNALAIDATSLSNPDMSPLNYYAPYNGPPLSPVFEHLPLLGSDDVRKFRNQPFQESFDTSPVFPSRDSDFSQESVLFGPTPSLEISTHSPLPSRVSAASNTQPDMRALITSGYDRLEVPPRRHSFNGPSQEGRFFFASESSASTPNTPFSSFSSSPGASDGTSPQLEIPNPQVASPANVQASNARRKKPARFRCSLCGSSFTAQHNLENHKNSHSGIKRHVCSSCGSRHTTRSVLVRHFKTCQARRRSPS